MLEIDLFVHVFKLLLATDELSSAQLPKTDVAEFLQSIETPMAVSYLSVCEDSQLGLCLLA